MTIYQTTRLMFRRSIRENRKGFCFFVLAILLSTVTVLLPPLALEYGVNQLADGHPIDLLAALGYFALIVLADFSASLQEVSVTQFGQRAMHVLRSAMLEKLGRLPTGYFTSHAAGDIDSVLTNDVDTITALYSDGVIGMLADSWKLLGVLFLIFWHSPGLGILLLLVLPALFALTRRFQHGMLAAQKVNRLAIGRMNHIIPETCHVLRMIQTLGKESFMEKRYDAALRESYDAMNRSNGYDSVYSPIVLVTEAAVIALMMLGAAGGETWRALFGLDVGSAVAVIAYVGMVFSPIEAIGMEIQTVQTAVAGLARIRDFLDASEERRVPPASHPSDSGAGESALCVDMRDVTFAYPGESHSVLQSFSLQVRRGEHVLLTGRTGAGKSTIFRLLLGLYRPDGGNVLLDGQEAFSMHPAERRSRIACVEQEFQAVPGSIRDQITLGNPRIPAEAVEDALRQTGLLPAIRRLPDGEDTPLLESALSKGQLQLLSVARAIVTSPEILLLDECNANLDSATEANLFRALDRVSENRTVLSIFHRYSEGNGSFDRHIQL